MRRRPTAGRPAVNRRMLVRPQPSQLGPGRHSRARTALAPIVQRSGHRSSNRGRGFDSHSGYARALGRIWGCDSAVSRARRVRFPSRALTSPSLSGRAPRSYRGSRGFDSSRRDCVARLVASPRVVIPWSRVRFPGGAPIIDDTGWAGTALIWRQSVGSTPRSSIAWLWGRLATPPVSGTGDRWFDSSRPDVAR